MLVSDLDRHVSLQLYIVTPQTSRVLLIVGVTDALSRPNALARNPYDAGGKNCRVIQWALISTRTFTES